MLWLRLIFNYVIFNYVLMFLFRSCGCTWPAVFICPAANMRKVHNMLFLFELFASIVL